jgi:CRISPR-associated protein Csy3
LYAQKGGFEHLARLYLWNIANGRFSWRNRFQADSMKVEIEFDGRKITFDPTRLNFDEPASIDELRRAVHSNEPAPIQELIAWIAQGLRKERAPLHISWLARMEEGQEIFPSQEYLRAEKSNDAPSRVYAKLQRVWDGRLTQASMHSQKIGAALRHIDIWHGSDDRAIAINPYGGVQETGAVLRKKESKKDFYALRGNADELLSAIEAAGDAEAIPGDVHFVIANLVRGGVFGQKGGADA